MNANMALAELKRFPCASTSLLLAVSSSCRCRGGRERVKKCKREGGNKGKRKGWREGEKKGGSV